MRTLIETQSAYSRLALVKLLPRGVVYLQINREIPTQKLLVELRSVIEDLAGKRKHRFIIDLSNALPMVREDRLLTDSSLSDFSEKVAFIYKTELGKMIARLFVNLSESDIKMKIFSSEDHALNWVVEDTNVEA